MRHVLPDSNIHTGAAQAIKSFHSDVVSEVEKAMKENEWVVVGMGQNPVVKSARQYLKEKQIHFKYISHGNYLSGWKKRLAIKLWSGWPTFPQVFHKGQLIGGYKDLKTYLEK